MALTAEQQRALNFNLSRRRRVEYCKIRRAYLHGSEAAKKGLTDRMIAITREENAEQRNKVRYDERIDDHIECGYGIVN